jgi:ubiquinone/menaquinone biosynthesis C-methylase UbiE
MSTRPTSGVADASNSLAERAETTTLGTVIVAGMSDSAHEQVVRESFRRQVGAFSGSDSVYAQNGRPLAWVGALDLSMTVLEVACGAGHAAESVAPLVRQVVGIDLTTELLTVGADRLRSNGISNILLQEGNAEALAFVARSFDLVFCRSSLHHFASPQTALEEMRRVTRPEGRIVLVDLVAPPCVDRERFDDLHRLLDLSHVRTFDEGEIVEIMSAPTTLTYTSTATLRFPIDVAISENSDRDSVLAALREEVAGGRPTGFEPAEEKGSLVVSFVSCVVHASTAKVGP